MHAPFSRGLAWHRYESLEDEFLDVTKYFPFEKNHKAIWSEFFSDFLTKIGNSVDSFFRNMLKDKAFDTYPHVSAMKKRKKDINYFRDFFEPIYELSGAEVDIAYGLTFYDTKYRPFEEFGKKKIPAWWNSYNHVKHTWFDCIEEATLENVVGALAGLFILNVLHLESREYLVKYQDVIVGDYMRGIPISLLEKAMKASTLGIPENWRGNNFIARTPLFTHTFRIDKKTTL
jgi:hypothetical protein